MSINFARYAAVVKNLRGVVIADLNEKGVESSIHWLVARFKYRNLGIGPQMINVFRDRLAKYLGGKPFRELTYPIPQLLQFTKILQSIGLNSILAEGLTLASIYISPLMVIGNRYTQILEELGVAAVRVSKEMNIQEWKLHMRIADYSILDLYEESIEEGIKAINEAKQGNLTVINNILRNRKARISKDISRYWRIKSDFGRTFLIYVDMLELIKDQLKMLSIDQAPALSIIPIIIIPPDMK
mgnify:CR=1 FL=1